MSQVHNLLLTSFGRVFGSLHVQCCITFSSYSCRNGDKLHEVADGGSGTCPIQLPQRTLNSSGLKGGVAAELIGWQFTTLL